MRKALDVDPTASRSTFDTEVYARRLTEPTPLNTLLRLFILGLPVPTARATEALEPLGLAEAEELDLIRVDGDEVVRELAIARTRGLWMANDSSCPGQPIARPDCMLGPGPASRTLAAMTVRRPVERA